MILLSALYMPFKITSGKITGLQTRQICLIKCKYKQIPPIRVHESPEGVHSYFERIVKKVNFVV